MFLDFEELSGQERYKLLTATIVPRPIALVTTRNEDGSTNAAPFSFFNVFSEDPPLVVLGLQSRPDFSLKDTTLNIRRTGEFVVNLVDESIAGAMVVCGADFAPDVSEIPAAGFTLQKSPKIDVDRIVEAPFSFACRRVTVLQFTKIRDLAIGEILGFTAREGLVDKQSLRVDWDVYQPVGRLYADQYIRTRDRFSMTIPSPEEIGNATP
ncbi:MAG: flavin reductase family protein [Hyphomicrobiales bacterium]|nr:flavin reductase family protein [Hyphomicrobiales bacterium]MCP4997255.1 flavin reductase family protein [Hyphomicrobiales bacterium]